LHPVQTSDEANEPKALDLMHRLNIAIHMASALDYLHHDCQMPIIHCDLKPSNILLDTNMTAHVGDFGLARFHSEASNQTSSVGLKGTIGYAAPGNVHSFSLFTGCEISFRRDGFRMLRNAPCFES
jgi:serine/threonine protein kinase